MHAEVDEHWVPIRNRGNDYLIDRVAQKTTSFTGIVGISEQDAAIQDSQGFIADRTREHLGPTDLGIVRFRRLVLDAAGALQHGVEPKAAAAPHAYRVRSGGTVAPASCPVADVLTARFGNEVGLRGGAVARRATANLHLGSARTGVRRCKSSCGADGGAVSTQPSAPRSRPWSASRASIMASTLRAPAWKMAVALMAIQPKPSAWSCSARRTTRSWSW